MNWNDIFKLNLLEKEGNNYKKDVFEFEFWDYNTDNIERETDHLANGNLNLN